MKCLALPLQVRVKKCGGFALTTIIAKELRLCWIADISNDGNRITVAQTGMRAAVPEHAYLVCYQVSFSARTSFTDKIHVT
jgi:hypothetical protein